MFGCQINGKNLAAMRITSNPVSPMIVSMGEKALSVSLSVRLDTLQMIQNPASFIQGTSFDPQPMASPRYMG